MPTGPRFRLLEGETTPPKWWGIAWVAISGWVMSTVALSFILDDPPIEAQSVAEVLFAALAAAGLSGLAARLGVRGKSVRATVALTFVGAIATSLVCAPTTWVLMLLIGSGGIGETGLVSAYVGTFILVCLLGLISAIPLGVGYGAIYAAGLSALQILRERASLSARDLALGVLGFGWIVVGAGTASLVLSVETALPVATLGLGYGLTSLLAVPLSLVVLGALALITGSSRWLLRRRFVARVVAGSLPDWSVVAAEAIEDAEQLPRLFSYHHRGKVLLHIHDSDTGPFRSGAASRAIARV